MTQIAPPLALRQRLRARRRPPLLREVYGQLIRRLRNRQGRTLAEVAASAGVSVAYLSEIERGLKEPSSEVLEAVCMALGSSIAHLVGAAHRELMLAEAASVERDLIEADGARVLDLTQRHPDGASRTELAPAVDARRASLVAA